MKPSICLFGLLVLVNGPVSAGSIHIDGDLNDWISKPDNTSADWGRLIRPASTRFVSEDQGDAYLNPGWGGQAYDAEAFYLEIAGKTLYLAIVTGLPPNNSEYRPGDVAFDFGSDGRYEYGLVVTGERSINDRWGSGIGKAGDLFSVTEWNVGLWDGPNDDHDLRSPHSDYQKAHPTSVRNGTLLGNIGAEQLIYRPATYTSDRTKPLTNKLGGLGGKHYVFEAAVPINLFKDDWGKEFSMHWTMGCNNDFIEIDAPSTVPEPTSVSMIGLGLVGMLGRRRLARRKRGT